MFALIETNGATHIAIHIPHEGADKTLPMLAAMLEQNAKFVRKGYQELTTVAPQMQIKLGDKLIVDDYESELLVAESGAVIAGEFVLATPDAFVSNAKGLKRAKEDNDRLRTENNHIKNELESLKQKLAELTAADTEV